MEIEYEDTKVNKVKLKKLVKGLREARIGWEQHGNCVGEDVTEFVYGSEEPSKKSRRKLERLCTDCPVLLTCRTEAVRLMELGWWGGMTESERVVWAMEYLFAIKE